MYDLIDRMVHLGKGMFNSLSTEGTTDNHYGLGSGHWCIIKAQSVDNFEEYAYIE